MNAKDSEYNNNHAIDDPEKKRYLEEVYGDATDVAADCYRYMQAVLVDLVPGQELTVVMPVLPEYLNPGKTMQGGFISAAMDNVLGPLCWMVTRTPNSVMTDMSTSYHRPIMAGDNLTVRAAVKSKGRRKIHMTADAYNGENKLVASSVATYFVLPANS